MRKLITGLLLALTFALTFTWTTTAAAASQLNCAQLAGDDFPETTVDTLSNVAARPGFPAYCEVTGTIATRIQFALRMPAEQWNGKFVVAGCSGFCGSLLPDKEGYSNSIDAALQLGYAAITTDSGHQAQSWNTEWALQDPVALDLYAGAWMPKAVTTGRAIISAYYGSGANRTYFSGCSNGGRLGLFAAQRYPQLFDAIVAGGGVFDFSGTAGVHGLWLLQTVRDKQGQATIDQRKIPLLSNHIMQQCDALDDVEDNIVSRPQLCEPNLDALQCAEEEIQGCLTRLELRAVKRLYRGATAFGERQFPGLLPGSEALWPRWVTGTGDDATWGERAAEGYLRLTYNIPWDQPFNPHAYKLGEELDNLKKLAPSLNATDPDLSAFAANGGKILYYQGLADPLIPPGRAIQYYDEVVAKMGAQELDKFGRFLLIPGHGHCWDTTGQVPDEFDPLRVINDWVEKGVEPDQVLALQKNDQGEVTRSRPLCAYPKTAVFKGGDENQAENYNCE